MIEFLIEFFNWVRARKYRKTLQGRPYFWGPPDSREGYDRYRAFLVASGLLSEEEQR